MIDSNRMTNVSTAIEAQLAVDVDSLSIGLCGSLLLSRFHNLLLFRTRFRSAIELQDGIYANFPNALRQASLWVDILPASQFPFQLEVCSFLKRCSEVGELSEDDTAVPFGAGDVDCVFAVGRLGCHGERGNAAQAVVVKFWIAAEKTHQGDFVLVHNWYSPIPISRLCSGTLSRAGRASKWQSSGFAEGPRNLFLPFANKISREAVIRRAQAEEQLPQSAWKAPQSVPDLRGPPDKPEAIALGRAGELPGKQ